MTSGSGKTIFMSLIKNTIRKIIRIIYNIISMGKKNTIIYFPLFTDLQELAHHYYAAKYFLPLDDEHKTVFFVAEGLKSSIGTIKDLPPPEYMGDCDWSRDDNLEIKYIRGRTSVLTLMKYRLLSIFVWTEVPAAGNMSIITSCYLHLCPVVNVNRHKTWDCYTYPGYRHSLSNLNEVIKSRASAQKKFIECIGSFPQYSKSYVFGTGPSAVTAFDYDFSDGYRIVCNTLVKSASLMQHIKPHFVVAADAIYHFGISKYAARFREDLEQTLMKHKCMLLMPESLYNNFIFHYPHLESRTILVPYTSETTNLDMKTVFSVKPMHNVLNQLLLPLGSSLANDVYLLGFDGRKNNDRHFWKSADSINYEELKGYHQKAHPGFFSGMDYEGYALQQSNLAEEIMTLGESMGKRYYCMNESSNAALAKRFWVRP